MEFTVRFECKDEGKSIYGSMIGGLGLDIVEIIKDEYKIKLNHTDVKDKRSCPYGSTYPIIINDENIIRESQKFKARTLCQVIVDPGFLSRYTIEHFDITKAVDIPPFWDDIYKSFKNRKPFGKMKHYATISYKIDEKRVLSDWGKLGYPEIITDQLIKDNANILLKEHID